MACLHPKMLCRGKYRAHRGGPYPEWEPAALPQRVEVPRRLRACGIKISTQIHSQRKRAPTGAVEL